MGWANCGEDDIGRPVGYAHDAICDHFMCTADIDRGLSYVCGGMHGSHNHGCGRYFCERHLWLGCGEATQLCKACYDEWKATYPDKE